MAQPDKWCFAWPVKKTSSVAERAALVKAAKWNPGDIITISFLDGDRAVQERVKRAAMEWVRPGMANLVLDWRKNTTDTFIRISFRFKGSWSTIGTTCKQRLDHSKPTMNFGWLDARSSDAEVNEVVQHEFGHALGLIHEHQNPGGQIQWNRDKVIEELSGPPNDWDLETIEHNMFEPYSRLETQFTKIDPKSIMMYPIPQSWTLDGFSVGINSSLSRTDRKFIRLMYP